MGRRTASQTRRRTDPRAAARRDNHLKNPRLYIYILFPFLLAGSCFFLASVVSSMSVHGAGRGAFAASVIGILAMIFGGLRIVRVVTGFSLSSKIAQLVNDKTQ